MRQYVTNLLMLVDNMILTQHSQWHRSRKRHLDFTVLEHHAHIEILQYSNLHLYLPYLAHQDQYPAALPTIIPGLDLSQLRQSHDRFLLRCMDLIPHSLRSAMPACRFCLDVLGW